MASALLLPHSAAAALSLRLLSPRRSPRPLRARAAAVAAGSEKAGAAVLWFKHDLRTDDHPGLAAAASRHRSVVPLYVFDPRILRGYPDEMLRALASALTDLRSSLRDLGSELFVGFGNAEDVILRIVDKVDATHVFAEEEVEYNVRSVMDIVGESLSSVQLRRKRPQIVLWRSPFYAIENLEDVPSSHKDFCKLRSPVTEPISAPRLELLGLELDADQLPTYDGMKKFLDQHSCRCDDGWASLKSISSEGGATRSNNSPARNPKGTVFVSPEEAVVGGGTEVALNALAAYLRYLEGTGRDDWQELHDKLRVAESRTGASFGALFGCALCLGVLSRRRVYVESIKYERERNAGFLSPFGYSIFTVAAAVDAVKSMEWYKILSLKQVAMKGMYPIRIWCWRGYQIQYTVIGAEGFPVLLVHGFGASLDHYRDNICPLGESGNRVWAITLIGFGKSEKPNVVYTENLWAECLRDFILDVVGEPVHLVGNSIGGYFAAMVAGLWPTLLRSVILVNTAGPIIPGYSSAQLDAATRDPPSGFAWLGARLLLLYLQLSARQLLKDCYPSNPDRADDWLTNEILRASYDPGVHIVLECVFNFKLPIPLNYLLERFKGPILAIQGTKDPLSKSKSRISMFLENCKGITIRELDAGHCPHDENPEVVNSVIEEWISAVESKVLPIVSVGASL